MFLDDEKFPPDDGSEWLIARSSQEAIDLVETYGIPRFISFDHDLGGNDTSRNFIHWLSDYMMGNEFTFFSRDFNFDVHSQNPIGAQWIQDTMTAMVDGRRNLNMAPDEKFQTLKNLITDIKRACAITGATIFYDGVVIKPDQIIVNDEGIFVKIDNFTDSLYEHTPDWDHGWYDPIDFLSDRIKNHFKLFKEIGY